MGPTYIEPFESGNFGYLPWAAEVNPGTYSPPKRYYNELFDTYINVCGDSTVISVHGVPNGGFVEVTPFAQTYANYAASFREGSFLRRLSHFFSLNGTMWAQKDFGKWLNGGNRCPEGTPGYEKLMPAQGVAENGAPLQRVRSVAGAMLSTNLFHFDREQNSVVFDQSILEMNFESQRSKNQLAKRGGFQILSPSDHIEVYKNGAGDILLIGKDAISWSTADRSASFGAQFVLDEHGRAISGKTAFMVRVGNIGQHPLLKSSGNIVAYVDSLNESDIPSAEEPLPINEVLGVYGYSYVGNNLGINADESVADHFKHVAVAYEISYTRWNTSRGIDTKRRDDISERLMYSAAEQYYIASAAYLSIGNLPSARSMLDDMSRCLNAAGVKYSNEVQIIEKALSRLIERSHKRNSAPPRPGGTSTVGGLAIVNETGSTATQGASHYTQALQIAGFRNILLSTKVYQAQSSTMAHPPATCPAWSPFNSTFLETSVQNVL